MSTPVTIRDLAIYRGAVEVDGSINAAEFHKVGLNIMGGCGICNATLAAYNGCPSKSGSWKCLNGCIDGDGWDDVAEANEAIFGPKVTKRETLSWHAVIEFPDGDRFVMRSIEAPSIEAATEMFREQWFGEWGNQLPKLLAVYAADAAYAGGPNEGWWP